MFLTVGLHRNPEWQYPPPAPNTRSWTCKAVWRRQASGSHSLEHVLGRAGVCSECVTLSLGVTWVPGKGAAVLGCVSVSE